MNRLIDEFDQIIRWPKKSSDKKMIIKWLAQKFSFKIQYSEKEINQIIHQHHTFNDIPLLRRELISQKYLDRTDHGSQYWRIN